MLQTDIQGGRYPGACYDVIQREVSAEQSAITNMYETRVFCEQK